MRPQRWILVALVAASACAHAPKSAKAGAAPASASASAAPEGAVPAAPVARACSGDDQCSSSELCVASDCVPITPGLSECRTPSVHFDFDRADLHADDQGRLQRAARCLRALPPERTLVEGNCDERGTVEYNLALGQRRAQGVRRYLEDLGVPQSNLVAVSYGKELPICEESAESCWSLNRRADVSRGAEAKSVTARIQADEREERAAASASSATKNTAAARKPTQVHRSEARKEPASTDATAKPAE